MKITLLITSSIAAYKSAEIVRELKKQGHTVRVAMSHGAREFVTPLTLQTLSGGPVATDLFDLQEESQIGHISLADDAELILVAPATANFIAKAAHGIADDLPTTILLATKAPVFIAPAMNVNMWENSVTQKNVSLLKERGFRFIEPESGDLACGWEGKGRLANPMDIVSHVGNISGNISAAEKAIEKQEAIIITAGPTREMLDPIRFISNRSSGKMGIALAQRAAALGYKVRLLVGPGVEAHIDRKVSVSQFESTLELEALLSKTLLSINLPTTLLMAAAPGDFRAAQVLESKLKGDKNRPTELTFIANPDVVSGIGENRNRYPNLKRIVAFCAESASGDELERRAREKLRSKKADFIVANDISESFATDTTRLLLLKNNELKGEITDVIPKLKAAEWLLERVLKN